MIAMAARTKETNQAAPKSPEVPEERADEKGAFLRVRGEREAVKGLCAQFAPE